ncbi:hypothetical protein TTHERM_00473070 (macronuclear) [Tetrahymena thermophila SB210]|uniref:Cyclic nucleotide-binding domain-containing protein n=1 Tax=Tetrahymena thermophila (strain SB210) TaxID=312017 RepID=I7MA36_TETTS|nr:hypothetical protein TTHERM_00473070 [Tetrahymena thermophila SB210]EAS03645.2 hypothetical protein TTHERM_00473070 [Tetrahymena thermophila SB210]|eukprot:XP_001023890.2 hypothetical protein TTHERM_00473070 [Tetrahymena thermophila SB210]
MSKRYIQKVSTEQLEQVRKQSLENQGQLRKISYERSLKDPIDILQLNKKVRNKEQLSIVSQYLKQFPNFKIIQNENNYNEKIFQFLDKTTYQKFKKGEFIFHNQDKNDIYYFILSGEISTYAKKSQQNLNRSQTPPIQMQYLGTQSTQSPQSQKYLEKNNIQFQQQISNFQNLKKQSTQNNFDSSPSDNICENDEDEDYQLLKMQNDKIGQYFEREGYGRLKYSRIQILKQKQCFGDLSKKYKSFSAVAKSDQVELLKIQNKDFTNIFDFFERKIEMTTQVLRKQFEGLVSDRILINLAYMFEDDGDILSAGEYVYRESDAINRLYIVKDGYLDLVKRVKNIKNKYVEKKISILSMGELFGYESLTNIVDAVKENIQKQNSNNEEDVPPQQKEEVICLHKFACKSTTERASIYWLDLKVLRKRDEYGEFFNHLNRLGGKKSLYYEERLQKMLQIEEKQHTDQASLSPSKQRDPKTNFKENAQGILERQSSNVFDYGLSPSQHSFSQIDELSSPLIKKKLSQNKDKLDQPSKTFQFKRNSSLVAVSITQNNNSNSNNNEVAFTEQTPEIRRKTYNSVQFGNAQQVQSQVEVILENDELFNSTINQTKFQLSKKKYQSFNDEFQANLQEGNQKINMNSSKNSFNSTNDLGFQLKPIYNNQNNLNNNQNYRNRNKKDNYQQIDQRQIQASPFSSPVKLRKMRIQDSQNQGSVKSFTTEMDNLSKKNTIKIGSNNQIIEEFQVKLNPNLLKISSYDTPKEYEEQMKQQIERKLKKQDSGRLLQRKRENEYQSQHPSSIDIKQVQDMIKIKEDIVNNKGIPKIVQLAASGLPTFEESERIQRVLKKSNTKSINGNLSISAVNNMTKNPQSYSPRNLKKGSANNSPNVSVSLNASISRIMKNRMNPYSDLNESKASYENISRNEINSPMKIKSFQKLNFFEEDDSQMQQISFQNLKQNQNSSPLISVNQIDKEIEANESIFKFTCESPRLKLQLKQKSPEPSLELNTLNIKENNSKQILLSPVSGCADNFNNVSEFQETVKLQTNKQNNSNEKFIQKQLEQQYDNLDEIISRQKQTLQQLAISQTEKKHLKSITAKLQEATRAQPNKNISLINSLGNRRHSSIAEDIANNSRLSNNLFPQFLNNRTSLISTVSNIENIQQKNTRSSSGSQKDKQEQTPLILKPQPQQAINQQPNSCQFSPNKQSKITLQVEEQKPKHNKNLTFNQNLLKKSLIRQQLHKKYSQIVSSSPFRDKIILLYENNQSQSQQNSQLIEGVNGYTINESPIKYSKNKIQEINHHFTVDPKNVFPQSQENSRNISLTIQNSNTECKLNSNIHQGLSLLQKYQQIPINKSLSNQNRFCSTQRIRNVNSLHLIMNTGKTDQDNKNKFFQQLNVKNLSIHNNSSERYHLAPLKNYSTIITNLPARQVSHQSLQNVLTIQPKYDPSSKNPQNILNSNNGKPTYQNINQLLKPINLSESTFREKKGFSLHSNF